MRCSKCHTDNPVDSKFCKECGTRLDVISRDDDVTQTYVGPQKGLSVGATFAERYQIIEELGSGGMGRVYKVLDTEIQEKIALKILRPDISSDEQTIERFRNEIKLARKIRHQNVCQMYDLMIEKGTYFITMEYVSGEDLKSTINRMGQVSTGKALLIAKQICKGLAAAHRHGVIHRDLKPANIMIDRSGDVRIMDFGIARSLKSKGLTQSGMIVGTPEYMSPEQAMEEPVDGRSDIYSLGVILFELVTGRVPFKGDTTLGVVLKHKTEPPPNPQSFDPQIPDDLNNLILRCLEKEKRRRPESIEAVLAAILAIEKGRPTTEQVLPDKTASTRFPRKRNRRFVLPLALVGVLSLAAAAYFLLGPKTKKVSFALDTNPSGAQVFLDNKEIGSSPLEQEIARGTYRLEIRKQGFVTTEETIVLRSDFSKAYELRAVTAHKGILEIDSVPEGAELYISGEGKGTTPYSEELLPGTYKISIRFDGYQDKHDDVDISAGQRLSKEYRLEPDQSFFLSVTSRPSQADVYIDDKFVGKTPLNNLEVAKRNITLRVSKEGWIAERLDLGLVPGRNSKHVSLNQQTYALAIDSDPRGARVVCGAEDWGVTPLKKDVVPGLYTLQLRLQGYRTEEKIISVEKDVIESISLLKLGKVPVTINVNPKAHVLVDGTLIREVPPTLSLKLDVGEHILEFVHPNRERKFTVTVEIKADEEWEYQLTMSTGRFVLINRVSGEMTSQELQVRK